MYGFHISAGAQQVALGHMAAWLVVCVARHLAFLAFCPALRINPHLPCTDMRSALVSRFVMCRIKDGETRADTTPKMFAKGSLAVLFPYLFRHFILR